MMDAAVTVAVVFAGDLCLRACRMCRVAEAVCEGGRARVDAVRDVGFDCDAVPVLDQRLPAVELPRRLNQMTVCGGQGWRRVATLCAAAAAASVTRQQQQDQEHRLDDDDGTTANERGLWAAQMAAMAAAGNLDYGALAQASSVPTLLKLLAVPALRDRCRPQQLWARHA
jgi:hypothetical protein